MLWTVAIKVGHLQKQLLVSYARLGATNQLAFLITEAPLAVHLPDLRSQFLKLRPLLVHTLHLLLRCLQL